MCVAGAHPTSPAVVVVTTGRVSRLPRAVSLGGGVTRRGVAPRRRCMMPSVIKLGSTGDDVKRLQRILARSEQINLDHPITGVFDDYLDGVVRAIQGGLGVPVD